MHALLSINARVSVSGATAPYTIQYGGCGNCATTANPATFTGLHGGNFSIIVDDANGCTFLQFNGVVPAPPPLVITFATTPQVSCTSPNGTATANPSGGTPPYTYVWSNGGASASLSGLAKGTYTVTVTDNKLCVATANASVDLSLSLNLSVTQPCGGADNGSATAIVSGGTTPYTYYFFNELNPTFEPTTPTNTGLSPGNYEVIVADNNNCEVSTSVTLTDNTVYDYPNGLVISTDTSWNGVHYKINKGIVVEPGVTFTILNSTLEFSDSGRIEFTSLPGHDIDFLGEKGIIVKNDATLRLFGVTMQGINGCNNMWDGIGVWGLHSSSSMSDTSVGVVFMIGSTISDAHTGIHGGSILPNDKRIMMSGLIHVLSSNFINNRKHVDIQGHLQNVGSYVDVNAKFTQTKFLCTAPLKDMALYNGEGTDNFMELTNLRGVKIQGCEFKNTVSSFSHTQRGTGINSMTSVYTVESNCGAKDPVTCECLGTRTKFENLTYGIYADAAVSIYPITVKQSDFVENYRGIYQANIYGSSFTRNKIDGLNLGANNTYYGIYLNGSAGSQLEENEFLVAGTPAVPGPVPEGYGIILNNTGSGGSEVYNNTFHDIGTGVYPQGQAALGSNTGLQIKCNDFTNNITAYHIAVPEGDIHDPQGLCPDQATPSVIAPTLPAGNTFTHECFFTGGDLAAHNGTFFRYNHHQDAVTTPVCYTTASVDPNNCNFSRIDKETSCPSNLGSNCCCDPTGPKEELSALRQIIFTADSSIKEGNNPALLQMIEDGQPGGKVKDALLAVSPYVSDRILVAFINKNHPYSPGAIKEVMLANSILTDTVISALLNRKNPLPPGIIKEILDAQTGVSARDDLEQELAYFEVRKDIAVHNLNRVYLNDTNITNPLDSVIAVLEQEESTAMKTLLSSAYIANGNYSKARLLLDNIGTLSGYANYATINNFIIDAADAGVSYDTLLRDSALLQMVENIAKDTLHYGYLSARAIMSMLFDTIYPEPIEPLPQFSQPAAKWSGHEAVAKQQLPDKAEQQQYIHVYPNPAKDKIIVEFFLEDEKDNGLTIQLFDIIGKEAMKEFIPGKAGQKEISVKNLQSGIYYYKITSSDGYLHRNKLVITK